MQAIWKGSVSFGLVTIPVKVFAATQEKDVAFRQVHAKDGGRIRYKRICEKDGEEVAYSEIAKGHELPDGQMLVLDSDDFAELPLPSKKVVDVLEFVPADEIDPIYVARSYYLQADEAGMKAYVLLRDALSHTRQVAIVKVALRNREALGMVRALGDVLLLHTLLWPDEVRDPKFAIPGPDVEVRPQEVAMAESYIKTLETDFEPDRYHDEYRQALEELISAKSEGRELLAAETPGPSEDVVDLMSALQASVEAAKKQRGEALESSSEMKAEEKPAKKAAKKGAPKKDDPEDGDPENGAAKDTGKKTAKAAEKKSAAKQAAGTKTATKTAKKTAKKAPAKKAAKQSPAKKAGK